MMSNFILTSLELVLVLWKIRCFHNFVVFRRNLVVSAGNSCKEEDEEEPTFFLPGFSSLSREIMKSRSQGGTKENSLIETKLNQDFELYETKAKAVMNKAVLKAKEKAKKEVELQKDTEGNDAQAEEKQTKVTVRPEDPLDFWVKQDRSKEYSTSLPQLAEDLLVVPATSVPSERSFNIANLLSDNKMTRITPSNLENRVIINLNPFLN